MLWAGGKTLYKKVKTTRLGEGLDVCRFISKAAMERTCLAVRELVSEGRAEGADVYAFATAAVRSAENGAEFCEIVRKRCDIGVDVISGRDEARLAVLGALNDRDGGIVDIGGASTEICVMAGGKAVFSRSLDVGAVRLYDACGEDIGKLTVRIEREIKDLPSVAGETVYAVGGTASTLACLKHGLASYDPEILQETPLSREWVAETVNMLFSFSLEKRKNLKGMDPGRADILAGAALLLQKIMKKMSINEVKFSDRDNLEGYLALKGLK